MDTLQKNMMIARSLNIRDLEHGNRVSEMASRMFGKLDLTYEDRININNAAVFHDIGKCFISSKILNKQGKLSRVEKSVMEKHVVYSASIGRFMKLNDDCIRYILEHHESYDGSGYPYGLKGNDISMGARILKLCDVFVALRQDRTYRPSYILSEVTAIMEEERNTFDPLLYKIFLEVIAFESEQETY